MLTAISHLADNFVERVNKELDKYLRVCCKDRRYKWAEYIPFFGKAFNNNYSEAISYTPTELRQGTQQIRFWSEHINEPVNMNLSPPLDMKLEYTNQRICKQSEQRILRSNRTHKLQRFKIG